MIEASAATTKGPNHRVNEDSILVDEETRLFVVADGMGGHSSGDVASQATIELVRGFVEESRKEGHETLSWPFGVDDRLSFNGNRLLTAVKLANREIWSRARSEEGRAGMGTTIVAALADDEAVTVCSAGDSRAYSVGDDGIEQLTEDDSWIRSHGDAGLDPEEIESHPMRNVITKAVGARETIEPQLFEREVEDGTLFLLCSDGVHKVLSDDEILERVRDRDGDVDRVARELVDAAVEREVQDDVSVVGFRVRGDDG